MLADSISAVGLMIAFYYGLTGFVCVWYFRGTLSSSVRNFVMRGLLPFLGGLVLLAAFLEACKQYAAPDYGETTMLGIGGVFVIGIGTLLFGVVLMFLWRRRAPVYFRGETLRQGHPGSTCWRWRQIAQRFGWGRFVEVFDVGGGNGTLLGALLAAHPELRGRVLDLPPSAEAQPRRRSPRRSLTGRASAGARQHRPVAGRRGRLSAVGHPASAVSVTQPSARMLPSAASARPRNSEALSSSFSNTSSSRWGIVASGTSRIAPSAFFDTA